MLNRSRQESEQAAAAYDGETDLIGQALGEFDYALRERWQPTDDEADTAEGDRALPANSDIANAIGVESGRLADVRSGGVTLTLRDLATLGAIVGGQFDLRIVSDRPGPNVPLDPSEEG